MTKQTTMIRPGALAACAALLGCAGSISIVTPTNGGFASVTGTTPVDVTIGGGLCAATFEATLDGVPITPLFTQATQTPHADLPNPVPGDHLLKVRALAGSPCTPVSAQATFFSVGPGIVYVTDGWDPAIKNDRVVRVGDMAGTGWTTFGSSGSGNNQFNFPRGIFIYSITRIYVADELNHRITLMQDMNGAGFTTFGTFGVGVNQFDDPIGIVLDGGMHIYVTDGHADRIVRIDDMNGTNWTTFGSTGNGVNQFRAPAGIALDATRRIYVTDSVNDRLVRINDMTGAGWTTLGSTGSGQNQFSRPGMIALDASGRIYVIDSDNSRVVRVNDMTGAGWTSLGSQGSGALQFDGQNKLMGGIFVDTAGRIYVGDSGNGRLVRMDDMSGAGWTTLGSTGGGTNHFVVVNGIFVKPPSLVVAPH